MDIIIMSCLLRCIIITEIAVPWLVLLHGLLHIPMASQTYHNGLTGVCCVTVGPLPWARPLNTLNWPVCTEYTVWNLVFAMTKTCQALGSHTQCR